MVDQNTTTFFNKLYDDTYRKVAIYVTSKCGCASDVDDIVQETYIDVYSAMVRKGIDYIKQPEAFVMKVCKSKIQKHYSLRAKVSIALRFFPKPLQDQEYDVLELEDLDYSLEDEVINRQLSEKIWELISSKEDHIQRIFRMFYG